MPAKGGSAFGADIGRVTVPPVSTYIPTIGLEIHAELKTVTKMFCNSKNDTDEKRPNWNVCPICLAHPGTLPVVNREAVRKVLQVGLALGGKLADYTEFDRKNYFYPDLPKGYQISQFAYPLVSGGELNGVQITRVHLEEDTGSLIHADDHPRISADLNQRESASIPSAPISSSENPRESASLVDFNRSGVPLMELVTEPVIRSAEEAGAFARELQLLLRYLGASEANMEKGEMRVEANVSVARATDTADSRGYEERIHADTEEGRLLYEELTYKIRGAAFAIYNALGSGHKESVYQNAFAEHLKKAGIPYIKEQSIGVSYEGKRVGSYQPDFVINEKIIVELKALPFIGNVEKNQVRYYLKNASYRLALLINFGAAPLRIDRIVYDSIGENPRESAPLSSASISGENPRESAPLGTKVEIKNLNSFRAMERAVAYEIKRQQELLERGEAVAQETRGWNDAAGTTFSQRVKEGSADYRYFPDPDLPSLKLSSMPEFEAGTLKKAMPELPSERRKRYSDLGLKPDDTEAYVRDTRLGNFFEEVIKEYSAGVKEILLASNYIANDLVKIIRDMQERDSEMPDEIPISPQNFRKIIDMVSSNKISSRSAKDLIVYSMADDEDPEKIAKDRELYQNSTASALETVVLDVLTKNPKVVGDYRAGKEAALEFLVGQCMKVLRGAADPVVLRGLIRSKIS